MQKVQIFAGSASMQIGKAIAQKFGTELGQVNLKKFSDGEFCPAFEKTVRGNHVCIIQSTPPPAENLFELLLMIDAAKRASAKNIVAVIPYFGFARQDRKDQPRVPIGAKLMANLLTAAGATRIMTIDLHADQIQGFFEMPVDHLYASVVFVDYIKRLQLSDLVFASADVGGAKRAEKYAEFFGTDLIICHKKRKEANVIKSMTVIGEVAGKNVILVDDLIDTAGTLCTASDLFTEKGAKSVRAVCTHPVLSSNAHEKILNSSLLELITTDTIPLKIENKKIKVISIAELCAKGIRNAYSGESINELFILK